MATPHGPINCPSPEPLDPHFVINLPLLSNFCILEFSASLTYTLPAESRPMPCACRNCPSPEPVGPQLLINLPLLSNTLIWSKLPAGVSVSFCPKDKEGMVVKRADVTSTIDNITMTDLLFFI